MEAINGFMGSKVKIICEKDKKKLNNIKKKYPKMIVTSDEETIFKDKQINLVSIASYDNYHFDQILKCLKNEKNIIVEKPMCLNPNQLKRIYSLIKTKRTKMTSNLVLRVNSLFKEFKKKIDINRTYYIEGDYIWGRRKNYLDGDLK